MRALMTANIIASPDRIPGVACNNSPNATEVSPRLVGGVSGRPSPLAQPRVLGQHSARSSGPIGYGYRYYMTDFDCIAEPHKGLQ